jgi:hypothetical protein
MFRVVAAAVVLLGASSALAQDYEVVHPKHSIVTFGDDTVDGRLTVPDGLWVKTRKAEEARSLIHIRGDFRREILSSLKR